jgi:hypothetical protein
MENDFREKLIEVIKQFSDETYENKEGDVKLIMGEDFDALADAILAAIKVDEGKLADEIEFNADLFLKTENDTVFGGKVTSINPKALAHALAEKLWEWVKIEEGR